jgi:energy-converting hydrogenase Eha subunit B
LNLWHAAGHARSVTDVLRGDAVQIIKITLAAVAIGLSQAMMKAARRSPLKPGVSGASAATRVSAVSRRY